jgi:hypothetical protein
MSELRAIAAGSVGAAALIIGYSAPAAAGPAPWGAFFVPHIGAAAAVANAVIGLATLPLTIAATVAGAGQPAQYPAPGGYAPRGYAPGYYAPPAYYPPQPAYYGAPAYYAHRGPTYARGYGGYPRYNAGFGYAAPHAGHYYHRR